jgi:hypothetical protein
MPRRRSEARREHVSIDDEPRAALLMEAIRHNDCESAYKNLVADMFPWRTALPQIAKLRKVSPDMQQMFLSVWRETKTYAIAVVKHPLLCRALRVMFPPYTGPAVRLFRGEWSGEAPQYGLAWTDDYATAERFARDYSELPSGSVILETVAPPAAIIAKMEYPDPVTDAEREEILREHPNTDFNEYHDESEFVVDYRELQVVTVVQRFNGTGGQAPSGC